MRGARCGTSRDREAAAADQAAAARAASAFPVCVAGRLPRRRFEACSVFTRVAARAVRCPPEEVFSPDASGHSSPPDPSGVLPAGARAAGWGSNPPNRGTFGQGTHTNPAERAIRPIAVARSFCPPSSSACEHWKLVFGIGSTRTGCSSGRGGHPSVAQVGGPDLVRSARHDLLGGKDALLDEPADAMVRDAEQSRGFRHGEPLAVLLGGAEGTNPVHPAQRADAVRGPRLWCL